jgi:Bacterial Ig domain
MVVCLGVGLGLMNETAQSAAVIPSEPEQTGEPQSSENEPPTLSVSSPADGARYPVGATIPFSATASDADGTIEAVAFYVDSDWYETLYSSPYGISLPNAAPGVYTLTAIAWDNAGASSMASLTLIVEWPSSGPSPEPSNQPPLVSLTAPASGAAYNAPASITVSATASDVDGTIAQVEFYANGTLIYSNTSSPYSFSWTDVSAGNYSLAAVARDDLGATTVSSTLDIAVRPANLPSTAVFMPSVDHETAVDRYVLEVFPVGADPTVANPVATRDLGKPEITDGECSVDISATIMALTPGAYIATVTAIGSGGSAQSSPSPEFIR